MKKSTSIPAYYEFFNPTLKALRSLGGSGSIEEINNTALEIIGINEKNIEDLHHPERNTLTVVKERLSWSRSYLKKFGLIENSSRGIWSLLPKAEKYKTVNIDEVIKYVRNDYYGKLGDKKPKDIGKENEYLDHTENDRDLWKTELYNILTEIKPDAFERLIQRILRESGFTQVEVTGRSGDGGIDGKGIAKIHGLMSFHVVFQAKRYKGVVTPSQIRDFRGAMVGRTDKGLFITTGSFTRDAIKEATRDGAPPIDLLDGDQLAEKLKELSLGVKTQMVEACEVDAEWFKSI